LELVVEVIRILEGCKFVGCVTNWQRPRQRVCRELVRKPNTSDFLSRELAHELGIVKPRQGIFIQHGRQGVRQRRQWVKIMTPWQLRK
jgi:hypothetical protein